MNSKKQPDYSILYLDRNIGRKIVPDILRKHSIAFELHDDHLPAAAPDEDCLELCSAKAWIAVTADKNLPGNIPFIRAALHSRIAIIVLSANSLTGE